MQRPWICLHSITQSQQQYDICRIMQCLFIQPPHNNTFSHQALGKEEKTELEVLLYSITFDL